MSGDSCCLYCRSQCYDDYRDPSPDGTRHVRCLVCGQERDQVPALLTITHRNGEVESRAILWDCIVGVSA